MNATSAFDGKVLLIVVILMAVCAAIAVIAEKLMR